MKIITLIILSFVVLGTASAQVDNPFLKRQKLAQPGFYVDILSFSAGDSGITRVDVFIQVPYKEVQFVKSKDGYQANYTVTISFFDEDKEKLINEKTWNEKLETADYEITNSSHNFNLSLRSFYLPAKQYNVICSVEDIDSRKTYRSENLYSVKDFSQDVSLSDLLLISKQTIVDGTNKIIPNVSRNVATQKEGIPFFFEIYTHEPRTFGIEYLISDKKSKVVYNYTETVMIDSGKTQHFFTIKDVQLSLGSYLVSIVLKDTNAANLATVSKTFFSRWVGIPSNINDLDKAISQMIYIANSSEIESIQNAKTYEEKIQSFLDYWKKKDPTPQTEENEVFDEYYRRIAFSNENFSHYSEGWKTDMGMVYTILGAPNNIDRHPFDYDSKPYEVWEYYDLNKSFIFVDNTGFGDYRLITPLYGDFYRFR